MKNLTFLVISTIVILIFLQLDYIEVQLPSNYNWEYEFDNAVKESPTESDDDPLSNLDWKVHTNDSNSIMSVIIPFAENQLNNVDTFRIVITKQKNGNNKTKIELIAPSSINPSNGIDIAFGQQPNSDDIDSIIWDGDGPVHLELVATKEKKCVATINDGLLQLENGKPYDFIQKCNGFNQLYIEFKYKNGNKKSVLQQLVTFTEHYRKIE
jgi:hypothetical protein